MKKIITIGLMLTCGCATGHNPRNQTSPQANYSQYGSATSIAVQGDAYIGNESVTVQGLSEEQVASLLANRDKQRDKQIDELNEKVKKTDARTEPTIFIVAGKTQKKLDDGKYQTQINLTPIGANVVPQFSAEVATTNGAKIEIFDLKGPAFRQLTTATTGGNPDRTMAYKIVDNVDPKEIQMTIVTDRDPEQLQIGIKPFKQKE